MRSQVGVARGKAQSNQDLQARVEELETEVKGLQNGLQSSGQVNFQLQVRCTLFPHTLHKTQRLEPSHADPALHNSFQTGTPRPFCTVELCQGCSAREK